MTATSVIQLEDEEETYDNFDPARDRYEWSGAQLDWREWDRDDSVSTTDFASSMKQKSGFQRFEIEKRFNDGRQWFRGSSSNKLNILSKSINILEILWRRLKLTINSPKFGIVVIVLVVLNCFAIAGELITDYIERIMYESRATDESLSEFESTTVGALLSFLETFFKYSTLVILGLQVAEMLLRVLFALKYFSRLSELFDLVFVVFTFGLNVYLFKKSHHHVHSVTGLIILIRLWRIKEVIKGVAVRMKLKHLQELKILQDKLTQMENQIESLNQQLVSR